MPKFVWEITARGRWAPQLFHGEMPREMTARENAHRYVIHHFDVLREGTTLADLAAQFPPPLPTPRVVAIRIETETQTVVTNSSETIGG